MVEYPKRFNKYAINMEQPLSQLLLKDLKMAPSFETAFFKSLESLGGGTKVTPPP